MPSLLISMMAAKKQMDDQTIANDILIGSKAAVSGYLIAALEAATPELRISYINTVHQLLEEHSLMMELAINRGWYKPYDMPEQQLLDTYKQSETMVTYHEV
jgi:spore coat protein CotF